MVTTVLRKKGQFTIPADLREEMNMKEDEAFSILTWNKKAMVLIPQNLKSIDILNKTAALAKKKGLTLEEMLLELDQIRHAA
jgi:bifunctional DNA-binding transcriptional regulator/antitoxin component of YhaV-PrlF toxin-antitoxin module